MSDFVFIIDAVATIGFEQPAYTFREGIDSSIEVCFKILSPDVEQIDAATFATVNIESITGSAIGNHYNYCAQHENHIMTIITIL